MTQPSLAIVILAAGKGKRMGNPDLPKVMVELASKPLIAHVLEQSALLRAQRTLLIVGHGRSIVMEYVQTMFPAVEFAVQEEQLGTGHAVQQTEKPLADFHGNVLILCGDAPLVQASTLQGFIDDHTAAKATLSVLSAIAPNPQGYGRIVRGANSEFERIVEQKDATPEQQTIAEINSGVYMVASEALFSALKEVKAHNAQQEYYLTDIVEILRERGEHLCAFIAPSFEEMQGINRPEELALAEAAYTRHLQEQA